MLKGKKSVEEPPDLSPEEVIEKMLQSSRERAEAFERLTEALKKELKKNEKRVSIETPTEKSEFKKTLTNFILKFNKMTIQYEKNIVNEKYLGNNTDLLSVCPYTPPFC